MVLRAFGKPAGDETFLQLAGPFIYVGHCQIDGYSIWGLCGFAD